jgi:hypothetical protein
MGKVYTAEDLAKRTYLITTIGVGIFIAVVFIFIL